MSKTVKKVVLAYSGGLDTSVILKWLIENYDCEVVTFSADIGTQDFSTIIERIKAEAPDLIFVSVTGEASYNFEQQAAEAGACANAQGKFWEYHDKLFAEQKIVPASFDRIATELGQTLRRPGRHHAAQVAGRDTVLIGEDGAVSRRLCGAGWEHGHASVDA